MEHRNTLAPVPVSINGDDVTTWALPEGAIARLGQGNVLDLAFSSDRQYFAVGTKIGLWLYDFSTLSPIALWDTGITRSVTFSPDNRWLAMQSADNVKIWDIERGICVAETAELDNRDINICGPLFSPDGQHLIAANHRMMRNGKIHVWCTHTGTKVSETEIQHPYNVYPLCFSPDFSLLAGKNSDENNIGRNIGDGDSIVVWQVETGEQIANITGYPGKVRQFCFSRCGQFLAAGDWHGTIYVWDVASGQLERTYTDYGDSRMSPYFPPEGELIAAAVSPRKLEIWNVEKGEKLDAFEHRSSAGRVSFSESGTQLATASRNEIQIWTKANNADTHTLSILHGHIGTIDTLVFSSDEKTLAAGLWRDNVLLWNIASRRSYRPHGEKLPGNSSSVYRSVNGEIISINHYGDNLNVRAVGKSEPLVELSAPKAGLGRAKAFSPTGHRIASADRDNTIHIWEQSTSGTESWKKHTTRINHEEFCHGLASGPSRLAFSPDGKRLASISRGPDCKAGLWDVDSGKQIAELPFTPLPKQAAYRWYDTGIAFSPRGDIIAGGRWGEIVLWDATDGKTLITLPQPKGNQRPVTLCFSPCGQYLVSGSWWQRGLKQMPIRLWDVATGKNIVTFCGHTTDVQCFVFSSDGTLLASGGYDGAIYLWALTPYL